MRRIILNAQCVILTVLLAAAGAAHADAVLLKGGLRYDRVTITDTTDGEIHFRVNGGRSTAKDLAKVAALEIPGDGRLNAAEKLVAQGKAKRAIPVYEAALKAASVRWKQRLIRYRLMAASEEAGDVGGAVRMWLEIVEASVVSPSALAARPRRLGPRGDAGHAQAIAALDAKLRKITDPTYVRTVRQLLADLYEREGRLKEAQAIAVLLAGRSAATSPAVTAPRVRPGPVAGGNADIHLAKLAMKSGDPGKALRQIEGKLKSFGESDLPAALHVMGKAQAMLARKQADKAAARGMRIEAGLNLMRVAALFGDSEHAPDALLEAGRICQALGNNAAARAAWREVMTRHGKTPQADQAKTALTKLDGAGK